MCKMLVGAGVSVLAGLCCYRSLAGLHRLSMAITGYFGWCISPRMSFCLEGRSWSGVFVRSILPPWFLWVQEFMVVTDFWLTGLTLVIWVDESGVGSTSTGFLVPHRGVGFVLFELYVDFEFQLLRQ